MSVSHMSLSDITLSDMARCDQSHGEYMLNEILWHIANTSHLNIHIQYLSSIFSHIFIFETMGHTICVYVCEQIINFFGH